jgi:hypothetical protein
MIYFGQTIPNHYYIVLLGLVFFILNKLNTQVLLSLIIIIVIIYFIAFRYQEEQALLQSSVDKLDNKIKKEVADVKQTNSSIFYIKDVSKNLKFLMKDQELLAIINNIRFIKKFDKTRYTNIIINMDKLMKVYVYILADRYDVNTYMPLFIDIKTSIMEIFYSLIFVVPEKFKHIYGFDPYIELERSQNEFLAKANKMISIIKNYNNIAKQNVYFSHNKYTPYEKNKESVLP